MCLNKNLECNDFNMPRVSNSRKALAANTSSKLNHNSKTQLASSNTARCDDEAAGQREATRNYLIKLLVPMVTMQLCRYQLQARAAAYGAGGWFCTPSRFQTKTQIACGCRQALLSRISIWSKTCSGSGHRDFGTYSSAKTRCSLSTWK